MYVTPRDPSTPLRFAQDDNTILLVKSPTVLGIATGFGNLSL
jgi:hypothetical protein